MDEGIEVCDKTYQAQSWEHARRVVIVRQKIQQRPQATGRTIAIGANFEKTGNTLKLNISLIKKRQKWFIGLWDYPIDLPLKIPNA